MNEFKIDGSQTTWLVYADWLEDQGIPAQHIRDLANYHIVNTWCFEYRVTGRVPTGWPEASCYNKPNHHGVGVDGACFGVGPPIPFGEGAGYPFNANLANVGWDGHTASLGGIYV